MPFRGTSCARFTGRTPGGTCSSPAGSSRFWRSRPPGSCASISRWSGSRSRSFRDSRSSTSRCCCTKSCTTPSSPVAVRAPSGRWRGYMPSRAASPRASSRAGIWIITRSWVRPKTIRSVITCRRRSTRAGSSCCIVRRRSSRFISARRAAKARRIRRRCSSKSRSSASISIVAHLSALAIDLDGLRLCRRAARVHHSRILCLPDRIHSEPPRSALRYRSLRSREVGHADARPLVLGFRLPQLELPSRAPLLRRCAVLPAARAAACARARSTRAAACGGRTIPACSTDG